MTKNMEIRLAIFIQHTRQTDFFLFLIFSYSFSLSYFYVYFCFFLQTVLVVFFLKRPLTT